MRLAAAIVTLGLLAGACAAAEPMHSGQARQALTDVRILSADDMQGRLPGTPGSAKARAYIAQRLTDMGITVSEQPFTFTHRDGSAGAGTNLIGRIAGTSGDGKAMVVSAHYDHLGVRKGQVFNGADDNASGVAGLLAAAQAFKATPPKHDVILAVVDVEEQGLQGAKAFVAAPPGPLSSIVLNVNLDMISKNAKNELYAAGASHYPFLKPMLEDLAKTAPVKLKLGHDTPVPTNLDDWTDQSDHYAFQEKGVPWVYFGVEDHPEYHKATDDFATVPPVFFGHAVATVVAATQLFDHRLDEVAKAAGR